MLRDDPAAQPGSGRAIGLVVADRGGVTDVEGRAETLRAAGWHVRVVVPDADVPVAHVHGDHPSEAVRLTLERLHEVRAFDVIEFPARGGLGLRAMQAARAGLAFDGVRMLVGEGELSSMARKREGRWTYDLADIENDYAERYARMALPGVSKTPPRPPREGAPLRVAGAEALRSPGQRTPAAVVTVAVPYFNLGAYLPETLASLAQQTYPHLDVVVIDDGSTDAHSRAVFEAVQRQYPAFRFFYQDNAGIGATRNRGLAEARGEYFLPFDADNVARPDMVARFVTALDRRPDVAALTCYFLAFATTDDLRHDRYQYAYRPLGGPHCLAALRNVYGDATAIYRAAALRDAGGWEADRDTSFEDWELFVKLAHAGFGLDVVPDHLFYYRHLPTGFSRVTKAHANHERVLRQFRQQTHLTYADRDALWELVVGMRHRLTQLEAERNTLRHRLADRLHGALAGVRNRVQFRRKG